MTKGGVMKKVVIAVAAIVALLFAMSAFAVEGSPPAKATCADFDQRKAFHMKKLDERINSLQQEKACVQAAQNQDELKACRSKHKAEMKEHRNSMKKKMNPGGPGAQGQPQAQ
jgi:hypothetical protein